MRRFRFTIALKYIILLAGIVCLVSLFNKTTGNFGQECIGLGIAAAGCFIAFALIENNDVRESNKE
jgi:hypothetical protein